MLKWMILILGLMAGPGVAAPLVVFAAASLKEPVDVIAAEFGDVVVSYGGSGTLARQVQLGAPADVILLANTEWMDVLETAGAVSGVQVFAGNTLVLAGRGADVPLTPEGLRMALGDGRLAMGFTAAVPAGIYGKQALDTLGVWDVAGPRVVEVDNVRAALALVARDEAPLGVTYATDLRAVDGLRAVAVFPAESHDPIRYVGALVSDDPRAAAFLAAVTGARGQAVLAGAGFGPAP